MFIGKGKPFEQRTNSEIWKALFFGFVICSGMFLVSFFTQQPQWFLWIFRGFTLLYLVLFWHRGLSELRKRKSSR
jgi:hypothetical protein